MQSTSAGDQWDYVFTVIMGCYFTLHGSPITPKGAETDNTGALLGKINSDFISHRMLCFMVFINTLQLTLNDCWLLQ